MHQLLALPGARFRVRMADGQRIGRADDILGGAKCAEFQMANQVMDGQVTSFDCVLIQVMEVPMKHLAVLMVAAAVAPAAGMAQAGGLR